MSVTSEEITKYGTDREPVAEQVPEPPVMPCGTHAGKPMSHVPSASLRSAIEYSESVKHQCEAEIWRRGLAEPTVPYDAEAELWIVGAALLGAVDESVIPEMLFGAVERLVYARLLEFRTSEEYVDHPDESIVRFARLLRRTGELQDIGGASALDRYMSRVTLTVHLDYYAKRVRGAHWRRKVALYAEELLSVARDLDGDWRHLKELLERGA